MKKGREEEPIQVWVGIDVSQHTLDVEYLHASKAGSRRHRRRVSNDEHGCRELMQWLEQEPMVSPQHIQVCLEATGWYSDRVSTFLHEQGCRVSVLNPAVLTEYRKVKCLRSKTDQHDAHLLALYGQEQEPRRWVPLPPAIVELRQVLSSRDDAQGQVRRERNRLQSPRLDPLSRQQIQERVELAEKHFQACEKQIKALLKAQEELHGIWKRLQEIDGIGWLTAARLIGRVAEIQRFPKVGALVSLAGLAVSETQSGTSVFKRPHIDHHGHSDLRASLYMGAISLLRVKKAGSAWAQRLLDRGKPKKVVIVALMRKLLHIAYGVWKTGSSYDASKAFPLAA